VKVLIVGGGAREHAIAWKLRQDDRTLDLIAAPGNPGIAEFGTCHMVSLSDTAALADLAEHSLADLTIIGPEAPLAEGLADRLRGRGHAVFGPGAAAARVEASKRFSKELMLAAGIPTAGATWHNDVESAKRAVRLTGAPVVIKASGLAAGKGVIVCQTSAEADAAIDLMLRDRVFGSSGNEILVEEHMSGEELSVFVLTDGIHFRIMLPAQDHKRLLDGDQGPNTGGMGAVAPVRCATSELLETVRIRIIEPVLGALREHGSPFQGLLYCGLMLTEQGPRVVEFNCRFGDPETEVVLPLLRSNLLDYLVRCSVPDGMLDAPELEFAPGHAVTTVVAAPGYPDAPRTGAPIKLPASTPDTLVFHAGTRRAPDGGLRTAGGRVVAVTGLGASVEEAHQRSLAGAEGVRFPERQFRRDIGWREMTHRAGAS
jgi:phosphoribosylamine--glycine ligase